MTARRPFGLGGLDRLGPRLAALLSLALLPLGAIAVVQTWRLIAEAETTVEAALIGATQEIASQEQGTIQTTIGRAEAFARTIDAQVITTDDCVRLLKRFVDEGERMIFAGFVERDGNVRCASEGTGSNLAGVEGFSEFLADPRTTVVFEEAGAITGEPVEIVTIPVIDDDLLTGFFSISLRHLPLAVPGNATYRPVGTVTFNDNGEILSYSDTADQTLARLPADVPLIDLTAADEIVIRARDTAGDRRLYTVAPLAGGAAHLLVAWPADIGITGFARLSLPTVVVPLLMWLASLSVAYFAVNRLVIRHIRRLRHRIRLFSVSRRVVEEPANSGQPTELREVADSFDTMAATIARDEAELENMIHEKDLLLREVYHRVRNNLQLIASIANMQVRMTDSEETRAILRRLQDRIMGMATIHQSLYSTSPLTRVRADTLILDLVRQASARTEIVDGRIKVTPNIDPVRLYPDQAVPLALLVYEALMNAIKYAGDRGGIQKPQIELRLAATDENHLRLEVRNTIGPAHDDPDIRRTVGLGTQLIHAFSAQLEGHVEAGEEGDWFIVRVVFAASDFGPEDGEDWLTDPLGRGASPQGDLRKIAQ